MSLSDEIINTRCVDSEVDEYGLIEHPTVRELILRLWAYCDKAGYTIQSAFAALDRGDLAGTILESNIKMHMFFLEKNDEDF